jgi:hypothetical protein
MISIVTALQSQAKTICTSTSLSVPEKKRGFKAICSVCYFIVFLPFFLYLLKAPNTVLWDLNFKETRPLVAGEDCRV